VPVADRRAFLRATLRDAGVAAGVLALLEGRLSALPRGEETDFSVLYAALMLEHHAIALYEHGLRHALFPPGLRAYAVEFRGDHLGHRDTQIAIAEERGGRPPERLASYHFPPAAPGDEFIRQVLEIEVVAQTSYTGLISQIRSDD